MHQTVGNVQRTLLHGEPPQNIANAKEYVDEALSIAMHAMRAGLHSTLGSSPRSLTYNRDMFLNIPLIADWHAITQRREHLINDNLIQENQKQRRYDYVPQQQILKKNYWKPRKLVSSNTDTCEWHSDDRVKTRCLRRNKYQKGYTVQRAHSHITPNVQEVETKTVHWSLISHIKPNVQIIG
jgi:hypothetical protein